MKTVKPELGAYLGRRTLIRGDVNSGKTTLTAAIVDEFHKAGLDGRMILLDLAPECRGGIGGKLPQPIPSAVLRLSCDLSAPRLTSRDNAEMERLAAGNAAAIEPLLDRALRAGRSILIVNDITLYLQAGSPERMLAVIRAHATAVINAYYGDSLPPAPFTHRERDRVDALARLCDRVIETPLRSPACLTE